MGYEFEAIKKEILTTPRLSIDIDENNLLKDKQTQDFITILKFKIEDEYDFLLYCIEKMKYKISYEGFECTGLIPYVKYNYLLFKDVLKSLNKCSKDIKYLKSSIQIWKMLEDPDLELLYIDTITLQELHDNTTKYLEYLEKFIDPQTYLNYDNEYDFESNIIYYNKCGTEIVYDYNQWLVNGDNIIDFNVEEEEDVS